VNLEISHETFFPTTMIFTFVKVIRVFFFLKRCYQHSIIVSTTREIYVPLFACVLLTFVYKIYVFSILLTDMLGCTCLSVSSLGISRLTRAVSFFAFLLHMTSEYRFFDIFSLRNVRAASHFSLSLIYIRPHAYSFYSYEILLTSHKHSFVIYKPS
jgi:hypothetical protein